MNDLSPSVLFLNDNSSHPNWGAQASAHLLIKMLRESIDASLHPVSWQWLRIELRELSIPFIRRVFQVPESTVVRQCLNRISRPIDIYPKVFDDFDVYADWWVKGHPPDIADDFVRQARSSDVVVYNAENSIYRNTIEGQRSLFLMYLAKTRLKKICCIINQTAHLTDVKPVMNAMVRRVYPAMDLITCREPASLRLLTQMGLSGVRCVPDPVFTLEATETGRERYRQWMAAHRLPAGDYFCMSASGLPVSRPSRMDDGAVVELVRAIRALKLVPVLMARDPHCMFMRDVARRTGGLFFGPDRHFEELWPLFQNARFLISGHYHYNMIAALAGCPFVPLSANNHKMAGLCELLEWIIRDPFDITDLRNQIAVLMEHIRRMNDARPEWSDRLIARSNALKTMAFSTVDLIRDCCRKRTGDDPADGD